MLSSQGTLSGRHSFFSLLNQAFYLKTFVEMPVSDPDKSGQKRQDAEPPNLI